MRTKTLLKYWITAMLLMLVASTSFAWQALFESKRNWADTFAEIDRRFVGVANVSTDEVAKLLQSNGNDKATNNSKTKPVLFDVRDQAEFDTSHLQGAVQVSDIDVALKALHGFKPDQEIIVYCSVGWRSSDLAQRLSEKGFTRVSNMRGGIFTWANEGRVLRAASGPVDQVHPFNADWGQLLIARKRAAVKDAR
jgi:rhodanese-related sulfurtransferase